MSMNYYTFVQRFSDELRAFKTDINPSIVIPSVIDYAEQRIYRELDLLATRVVDNSATVTAGARTFNLPTATGTFLVVESINVSTPSSVAFSAGTRNPLMPVTKQFLDITYPSTSFAGLPVYYAMQTNAQVVLGPVPDLSYPVEVTGTQRPTPLSSANSSTILTTMLPDLFLTAAISAAGDYITVSGASAPLNMEKWEAQYKTLSQSALVEEVRKKYQSQGWTESLPSPVVTPPRV